MRTRACTSLRLWPSGSKRMWVSSSSICAGVCATTLAGLLSVLLSEPAGVLPAGFAGCCAHKTGKAAASTKNAAGANLNFIEMNDRWTNTLRSLGAPAKRRKEEGCAGSFEIQEIPDEIYPQP